MILAGSVGLLLVLVVAVGKSSDSASLSDEPRSETGPVVAPGADLSRLVARFALAKVSGFQSNGGDVPPGRVPLPMLDLEPSVVQEVGAF